MGTTEGEMELVTPTAEQNTKENDKGEKVSIETAAENNTELLQSINQKLDLLLAAQSINAEG